MTSPGLLALTRQLRCLCLGFVVLMTSCVTLGADQGPSAAATVEVAQDVGRTLPSVMSINLCADQLVLLLADSSQIKALSTLSQDKAGSYFHESAKAFPRVEAAAEQILPYAPDVVLTGPFVSRYTLSLLAELGLRVESLEVATSIDAMLDNIRRVGDILQRESVANSLIAALKQRIVGVENRVRQLDESMHELGRDRLRAAVYDANGYTVGRESLRGQALQVAGWHNVAEDRDIESYGVISLEDLIRLNPDALIESPYSEGSYSRGQQLTQHPALRKAGLDPLQVTLASNQTICAGPWSVGVIERLVDARESLR